MKCQLHLTTPQGRHGYTSQMAKLSGEYRLSTLLEICFSEGFHPSETGYIGDSMARDMLMARRAGAFAIWASYGARHDPEQYAKLVRITHWTDEDVRREEKLKNDARNIDPDFVAERSFSDLLAVLHAEKVQTSQFHTI